MEIETYSKDGTIPETTITMQLLRTTCPKCHSPVEFVLSDEDKQYKNDAEYFEKQLDRAIKEIKHLNAVIERIVSRK